MTGIAMVVACVVSGPDLAAIARGKNALESTAFIPGFWPPFAYDLAWKPWGVEAKPRDYDRAFRERYGLHEAPYPNGRYPMGLREAGIVLGKGIGIDCMTCHGGSIHGKSMVGLGNSALDIHSLFEDMYKAGGIKAELPFVFSQARGTNEAGAFGVYLLGLRSPDLTFKSPMTNLDLKDDSVEDVPAWWLLKKKKTMYYPGDADARSVRALMQFMMHPLTTPADFKKHESAFRDIQQYLLSLEPPKYPGPINRDDAEKGRIVFGDHCAKCHGRYGDTPTYPNKIVPLDEIGTDPNRFRNIGEKYHRAYSESWFGKEEPAGKGLMKSAGYQAPPLDGIWATAPYFHNGSVPTLEGVLNSQARPRRFTRSFLNRKDDYDFERVGWKVTETDAMPKSEFEKRMIYETSKSGRSNAGHRYGDDLTPDERKAIIEYLKTL